VEVATILLLTGLPTPLWNEIYLFARLPTPRHVHCNVRVPTTQASLNPPCRCLSLLICGDPSPCACYCSPLHVFEVTYSPKLEFITLNLALGGLFRAFISWKGGVRNYWGRHSIVRSLALQRRDRGSPNPVASE
jgi:hypothetical protein